MKERILPNKEHLPFALGLIDMSVVGEHLKRYYCNATDTILIVPWDVSDYNEELDFLLGGNNI